MHEVYDGFTPEQEARETERQRLVFTVPELRARGISMFAETIDYLNDAMAERMGRSPDDPVRADVLRRLDGRHHGAVPRLRRRTTCVRLLAHIDEALVLLENGFGR